MAYDSVFKNGDVGGAAADVDQDHAGFFFFLAQYGLGAGQGFEV